MLHPPDHQVAGHKSGENHLGPLIDNSGLFYKPLQTNNRGPTELSFYSSFSSNPQIPPKIRPFFPSFHGTKLLLSSSHPHLILSDLFSGLHLPSVIDIKIGARTWSPSSPQPYLLKCLQKDRNSTSAALGFRISGLQIVFDEFTRYRPTHDEVREFKREDVCLALRRFVSADGGVDCELAREVYGGVLEKLGEVKGWFEEQTFFHFCSASVLVGFGRDEPGEARVGIVDFAHVEEGGGVIDHNFLGGLCSLIKFVGDVVEECEEKKSGLK